MKKKNKKVRKGDISEKRSGTLSNSSAESLQPFEHRGFLSNTQGVPAKSVGLLVEDKKMMSKSSFKAL
jgi:hypothetical protein